MISLFCKRALQKRLHSAKKTYDFKEPTTRSQGVCPSGLAFKGCIQSAVGQSVFIELKQGSPRSSILGSRVKQTK